MHLSDSIIYISLPECWGTEPAICSHGLLGRWTNEIKKNQAILVCLLGFEKATSFSP